jgi:hypothetical protein
MPSRGRIAYDMTGIASLLAMSGFRVPIYQRSFAWEATEVDEFWDDLMGALDAGEPDYFLGTTVLTPSDEERRLTIIDGQQRLATTSLFLAALRNTWRARGEEDQAADIQSRYLSTFDRRARTPVPRLMLNEEDDPYFRELVVESKDPEAKRESHVRLKVALENISSRLVEDLKEHGSRDEDRLLKWLDFLDDQALVISVTVPTEADAFVIFEALNDRGAVLTIGDLLKNYLFMRAGKRLETVKNAWVSALAGLDVSAENELFINFLRHDWSSRHGSVRERELYGSIKQYITTPEQAVEYANALTDAARHYSALLTPSHDYWRDGFAATTRANVETLLTLALEQNRPLLLAVMSHFSKAELQKTLRALVNWSVRGIVVGGIGGGRTERAYADAAMNVRAGKIKDTRGLLRELSPIIPDDVTFQDAFVRVRQTNAAISRYLLIALERTNGGEPTPELVPNSNQDEVNLEHILPRNAKPADWPSFKPEEVPVWSSRVGNHCLLKKTENAQIGSYSWSKKKPVLAASSLTLTNSAAKYKDWTRKEIEQRQRKLAALAVQTWPRSVK